ncbi:MAG TPA: hypothetical protein VJ691_09330 [Vicinamibacterales bacterium]|nr:hypothetical protein [Vicinamibacterales bacterium]
MPAFDSLSRVLGALAAILGTITAALYWRGGLSLSHYDSRAHLVVARRVFDSLTPSWEQIGAVWLPLPHVLNAVPVQIDWVYRTGASAIVISVASFALTVACLSAMVRAISRSRTGAILAALLFALNPNVLYLQSTPMTEPLLFALSSLALLHLTEWALSDVVQARAAAGWSIALACLTRYEAWPIIGAGVVLAAWVKWRRGAVFTAVVHEAAKLALYAAATVVFFMLVSFTTTGRWFVTGGFYVPDPKLQGQPMAIYDAIRQGVSDLGGPRFAQFVWYSVPIIAIVALLRRSWSALIIPVALMAAAALPFYAYYQGHPFIIRYQTPLILGGAACIGAAVSLLRFAAPLVAIPMLALVMVHSPLFDPSLAPIVVEAQVDQSNGLARRAVTECLRTQYDRTTIMASMGSLAHYLHELSHAGFDLDDFIHEGSGPLWAVALHEDPSLAVGWILIEEFAEGGDVLFQRANASPKFLSRFERVCEGGNVALYKRKAMALRP